MLLIGSKGMLVETCPACREQMLFCVSLFTEAQLLTCCSLPLEIHLLLDTRCKITRYSLQYFLVIRCRRCSLQKITRYSLQKLVVAKKLVAKIHLLLVAKFACYSLNNLLVVKNHSLLVAEVSRSKKSLVTR